MYFNKKKQLFLVHTYFKKSFLFFLSDSGNTKKEFHPIYVYEAYTNF